MPFLNYALKIRDLSSIYTIARMIEEGSGTIEALTTNLTSMIVILDRLDLILTMFTKEMNPPICPSGSCESTSSDRTLKVLLIFLVIPLNMEVKRLLLRKLLSTSATFVR